MKAVNLTADGLRESNSSDRSKEKLPNNIGKLSDGNTLLRKKGNDYDMQIFHLILQSTNEYLQRVSAEISRLKNFATINPKSIEAIRKHEILAGSLRCHMDILTINDSNKDLIKKRDSASTDTGDHDLLTGILKIKLKKLDGFFHHKHNGDCEITITSGKRKYRARGSGNRNFFNWNTEEITIHLVDTEGISLKLVQLKGLIKATLIGRSKLDAKGLIAYGTRESEVCFGENKRIRLKVQHEWTPFDFNDMRKHHNGRHTKPAQPSGKSLSKSKSGVTMDTQISSFIVAGNEAIEQEFLKKLKESNGVGLQRENTEVKTSRPTRQKVCSKLEVVWAEAIITAYVLDYAIGDIRGRYTELRTLEMVTTDIIDDLECCTLINERHLIEDIKFEMENALHAIETMEMLKRLDSQAYRKAATKFSRIAVDDDKYSIYCAIVIHIKCCIGQLKDVCSNGPMKVRELHALHRLQNQGRALHTIREMGRNPCSSLEDYPIFANRRAVLEFWRSCCDGNIRLCVTSKILRLEFESEFGREIKKRHPDVIDEIFPELISRIIGDEISDNDQTNVSVFQLLQVCESISGETNKIEDLEKCVGKLAQELQSLPYEVVLHIFKFLDLTSLSRCTQVCKLWRNTATTKELWKRLSFKSRVISVVDLQMFLHNQATAICLNSTSIQNDRESGVWGMNTYCHGNNITPIYSSMYKDSSSPMRDPFSRVYHYKVQHLDFTNADVNPTTLCLILTRCNSLLNLSLENLVINHHVLGCLSNCRTLLRLNLSLCKDVTVYGLIEMLLALDRLLELNLAWSSVCKYNPDEIFSSLPQNLTHLNIAGFRDTLYDGHIAVIISKCKRLQELDISDSNHVTSHAVDIIIHGLSNSIRAVNLSRCYSITPDCYLRFMNLPFLHYLDVFGVMDDASVAALAEALPRVNVSLRPFSAIARPTPSLCLQKYSAESTIWGHYVKL